MKIFKSTAVSVCLAIVGLGSSATTLANNNFSGPYIGVETAYIHANDKGKEYDANGLDGYTQNLKPDGMGVGILGGYNWALGSKAIAGLEIGYNHYREADAISGQNYNGSLDCDVTSCEFKTDIKQSLSAVGRLGYLVTNNMLVYGLFGYSSAEIERSLIVIGEGGTSSETHKKWQDGWVAGAGVEYLASKNVSVKLEYRYTDLGNAKYRAAAWGGGYTEKFDYTQDQVLLGVNYRF